MKTGVGLIGCGTVGTGVVKLLASGAKNIQDRTGVSLFLAAVCDKDSDRLKEAGVDPKLVVSDAAELIHHEDVDIVIELIGGTTAAYDLTCEALSAGKPVVTANKALIAVHGQELFTRARKAGTCMAFEASVCAGVPVIASLRDSMVANEVTGILGIVNGTSNYILTRMAREGATYDVALAEAREKGYAEADPTFDVEGIDSAHKLAILSRIAFGANIDFEDIYTEGITRITPEDIKYAEGFGYTVKLLAVARDNGALDMRVHPALLPADHALSFVDGALNAVCFTGDSTGNITLYGLGAGQGPTASAIVADLIEVASGKAQITFKSMRAFAEDLPRRETVKIEDIEVRYYARFSVADNPGVLSRITGILGENNISISSVIQAERHTVKAIPIVMMTYHASERDFRRAVAAIDELDVVKEPSIYLRVEQ